MSTYRIDARWAQNGVTLVGGNGWDSELNYFARPLSIDIDDKAVYVSDHLNHPVIEWKSGSMGDLWQVAMDKEIKIINREIDSYIICDYYKKRVVR